MIMTAMVAGRPYYPPSGGLYRYMTGYYDMVLLEELAEDVEGVELLYAGEVDGVVGNHAGEDGAARGGGEAPAVIVGII